MSAKKSLFYILFLCTLLSSNIYGQCLEIESILVDACGADEGLNEMVRFKVGNAPINTNTIAVSWPNNSWLGLIQNSITNTKTAELNADILASGGCGQLIEPVSGIIPANSSVILVTSFNLDTALNSFGALTQDFYIIYQNNPSNAMGHFANFGTGMRTLTIIAGSCVDIVTYNRALLTTTAGTAGAADGATVEFTTAGTATYINNGCSAPVPIFSVDAGTAAAACSGSTITLTGNAQGFQSVLWTAASGTFSSAGSLNTSYTIDQAATGTIVLTLSATNACGVVITDTVNLSILSSITPTFPTTLTICTGSQAPSLNITSPNGISGSWNPSTISNTASGTYVFTPNAGQCAIQTTLDVVVTNQITPNFASTLALCDGASVPTLASTSPNGIQGGWSPSTINNTQNGTYTFTPNPGQCATVFTLTVTVGNTITPDFPTNIILCSGSNNTTLSTTSPNGISGTWNPAVINNLASGIYTFTPASGQCAVTVTTEVNIIENSIPDFETEIALCNGQSAPELQLISPNGITGLWNPAVIDNTQNGTYIFTPDANQCAQSVSVEVTVSEADFTITQVCRNGVVFLEASDVSNIPLSYEWTNESGQIVSTNSDLDVKNATSSGGSEVTFPVSFFLTITFEEGCTETRPFTVQNILCGIPKGVSPNGDNMNDTFNLLGLNATKLQIFNRHGMEVYSLLNYSDQWDGRSNNGDELPDGTYYYVIHTNSQQAQTGWVYLIRNQ